MKLPFLKLPNFSKLKNNLPKTITGDLKIFIAGSGVAFAIAVFSVLAANILYQPKKITKHDSKIEISTYDEVAKREEKSVNLASMMKTADTTRGEKIFRKCTSCHNINKGEGSKIGPNLFGVVGRAHGSSADFSYSKAMKTKGGFWDEESINRFITKPKDFIPGTTMVFPGLSKPQDRADIILFLENKR